MTRAIEYITVPSGTPVAECRGHRQPGGSCRAPIYWIERVSTSKKTPGKIVRVPVDCDYDEQCERPREPEGPGDEGMHGLGVNHYQTCPDAGKF